MRGTIEIPKGWPMCTMSLNAGDIPIYSKTSGNHPCTHKGLPTEGIPTFKLDGQDVPRWFYCKNENG
jgi:hypothetical protein